MAEDKSGSEKGLNALKVAVVSGVIGLVAGVVTTLGGVYVAKQKSETELIKQILDKDLQVTKSKVSLLRLIEALGLLKGKLGTEEWNRFVAENPDKLPRFYKSGNIWTRFHKEVPNIRKAYEELNLLEPGSGKGAGPDFAFATFKFQLENEEFFLKDGPDGKKIGEKLSIDGIVGPATFAAIYKTMKNKPNSPWAKSD